jgi:hypothetical protein
MKHLIKENTILPSEMARAKGQSDEGRIIAELARDAPRTFIEFGFHPIEFNCAELARDPEWRGRLIDGTGARSKMPARCFLIASK